MPPRRTPSFPLGAPGPGARNPALRGALCARGWPSPADQHAGPRYPCSLAPARRRGRRSTRRKPTPTLGDDRFPAQTPMPGTRWVPGYLVPGYQGNWPLANYLPSLPTRAPRALRGGGGDHPEVAARMGKGSERRGPLPPDAVPAAPPPCPPSPPSLPGPRAWVQHAGHWGLRAPASRRRPLPGMGARGAGHKGAPTSSRPPRQLRHTLQGWQGIQREPRIKVLWLSLSAPSPGVQLGAPGWSSSFSSTLGCPSRFHQPTSSAG